MGKGRVFGLLLAGLLVTLVIAGAATLIAADFVGTDGLARLWSALVTPAPATELLEKRLRGVADIDLFVSVDVPGTDLKVSTGTAYADARALAEGRARERWCYVERDAKASSFTPRIDLGRQQGRQPPVLGIQGAITPEQARLLGVTPELLASLPGRYCRFG